MSQLNIGDKVKLLPPFSTTHIYTVLSVSGLYVTLFRKGEHKNLVIYIKCIQKLDWQRYRITPNSWKEEMAKPY